MPGQPATGRCKYWRPRSRAAWRESAGYYTATERAALALTEELTRCTDGVSTETLHTAREHFTPNELVQLVYALAAINAWNRLTAADSTPTPARTTAP